MLKYRNIRKNFLQVHNLVGYIHVQVFLLKIKLITSDILYGNGNGLNHIQKL